MTQVKHLVSAALISFAGFSATAHAVEVVNVACYGNNASMLMSFYEDDTGFFYSYSDDSGTISINTEAQGSFSKAYSYVTVAKDDNTAHLKAQIISGDPINPIIEVSAEATVVRDHTTGSWILTHASLYNFSQPYDLNEFIGLPCYVQ